MEMMFNFAFWGLLFGLVVVKFFGSICLVPTRKTYIVERLGRYHKTLGAGFHALIPFVDKVTYVHDLKEQTIEVPPQDCFSKDEVKLVIDGLLYISVVDPTKVSYGIDNYHFAAIQLAQTTTRSVIGKIDLDRTFEEREYISAKVVEVLDRAGASWGIRVHRYEIKNITPPVTVRTSMEKQVTAERQKLAILAKAEGDRQSNINTSEGLKMEMINHSEGEMQKRINEAEGRASEILTVAKATAESITKISRVVKTPGGERAMKVKLSERFFRSFRSLADGDTRVILPADMVDLQAWLKKLDLSFSEK